MGVGSIRAASSRTGELSIHLKQQDIQIPKRNGGVREVGQTKMPISKALESIQATVPGLGFLSSRTLLGCPLSVASVFLQSASRWSVPQQAQTGRCRLRAGSQQQVQHCSSGFADFSPAVQFLGQSQGPTTQCNHIELLFPVDPQLGNGYKESKVQVFP